MNRQNYRAAFDAVDFSPDFEERTLQKLAAMRHASEKEQNKMSMNRTKKSTLLAAAAVALLAVTVSAAVLWLTPAQVAEELNDPMLAEAFQSEAAVILNETQTVGDYGHEALSLPFAQIGELFGKTESWARVTYFRARQKLKEGFDGPAGP